jgi:hypothetical protein
MVLLMLDHPRTPRLSNVDPRDLIIMANAARRRKELEDPTGTLLPMDNNVPPTVLPLRSLVPRSTPPRLPPPFDLCGMPSVLNMTLRMIKFTLP